MMMLRYRRAIPAVTSWWVIAMIVPLAILLAFMIQMWAGACRWKSALLIADAISWSILLWGGTLVSLLKIRRLSAMFDPVIGVGPGPPGNFWLCIRGCAISHCLAGTGVSIGLGFGLCRSSGCRVNCSFSLGLGFGCCGSWRFSGSASCIVPACWEATRPPPSCLVVSSHPSVLAFWSCAALCTVALVSTSVVMSVMLVPQSTLSLLRSSHFDSQSSSHSFMLSHWASSPAVCASNILVIWSIVWCSWVTSRDCWLTVCSIWLLKSPGALTGFEVSFLSLFPFFLLSHWSLAAMKDMRVVFPDCWPAALLVSPASTICISLSTGGFSTISPIRLLPSWVAIVASLLDISSLVISLLWLSSGAGSVFLGSVQC